MGGEREVGEKESIQGQGGQGRKKWKAKGDSAQRGKWEARQVEERRRKIKKKKKKKNLMGEMEADSERKWEGWAEGERAGGQRLRGRAPHKANRTVGGRSGNRRLASGGGRRGTGGQGGECAGPEEDGEPAWGRGSPKGERGKKMKEWQAKGERGGK